MGFEALLGNDRLKENLANALRRQRSSHFYLISGPQGSGKKTLARLLSAAVMCTGREKPCGSCPACRKVLAGVHPDQITVTDPEHKNVAVKIIRQVREEMFIRPNEGDKKIYVFPQSLGIEGQNALLKILEEPPAYGVFILLSDNPEQLLPTVRSRCVELKLQPLDRKTLAAALRREFPQASAEAVEAATTYSGGYLGQARQLLGDGPQVSRQSEDFAHALAHGDRLLLTQTLVPMEKWKRDQLIPQLQQWLEITEGAMICRTGMPALSPLSSELAAHRSAAELQNAALALKKAQEYAQSNVSAAAICGWLTHAL